MKISKLHRIIAKYSVIRTNQFFSILAKDHWKIKLKFSRSALLHIKTRVCLKYFGHYCSIVNYVYELRHKLPNDLRLRNIGNQEMKEKSQNCVKTKKLISSLPSKNKVLTIAIKTHAKVEIKVLLSCPNLPDFLTFGKIFFHWL